MATQNQYIKLWDCRILREVRPHEIPNEKVLGAVQMKTGRDLDRDTREQEIVGVIYEQLGSPRAEGELDLQRSPM